MKKRLPFRLFFLVALLSGTLLGVFVPRVAAVPQWSYGGYRWAYSNRGSSAQIPYWNPSVPTGFSTEWVMSALLSSPWPYIQSGWMKWSTDSGPRHFVEYYCPTKVCRYFYGSVPPGTTHEYKVAIFYDVEWCGFIDGACKAAITFDALGMHYADATYYTGETSDTDADMGGTPSNHLHMYNLSYQDPSTMWWIQVNTNSLVDITTPGTPYRASKGYSYPYTWVENWTQR
jgi:hypothetical protein